MKKKIVVQITNNAKYKKDYFGWILGEPDPFFIRCTNNDLPTTGDSYKVKTYEAVATVFNNAKLTKTMIKNTLRNADLEIEGIFKMYFNNSKLRREGLKFAREKGCFKIDVIAILDHTED